MTETKKKINPVEVVICLFLTAVIVVTGFIGYTHKYKIWIFEAPLPPVSQAGNGGLLGGRNGMEPGWHSAVAPKAVRDKLKTCPEALEWAANCCTQSKLRGRIFLSAGDKPYVTLKLRPTDDSLEQARLLIDLASDSAAD